MVGIPIETPEGVEEYDRKFKPNATSQYLFPFFRYFLKINPKTGQLERLEDWFGSNFAPKRVSKSDFLAASKNTLKYLPYDSPKYVEFNSQLESLCVDEMGWEQYSEALNQVSAVKGNNVSVMQTKLNPSASMAKLLAPVGSQSIESCPPKISQLGKSKSQKKLSGESPTSNTTKNITSRPKLLKSQSTKTIPSTRKKLTTPKFVDIDWAVCLLLRVWDADYEWKQVITLTSAIVLLKRYMRRYKGRKSEPKAQEQIIPITKPAASPKTSPKNSRKVRVAVLG